MACAQIPGVREGRASQEKLTLRVHSGCHWSPLSVSDQGATAPQGSLEQVLAAAGGWTGMGRVQAERPGDHYSGWAAGWWLDPVSSHG